MKRIRLQRARLRALRDAGALKRSAYRDLYLRASGAQFRNLAHLNQTLEAMGVQERPAARKGGRKVAPKPKAPRGGKKGAPKGEAK